MQGPALKHYLRHHARYEWALWITYFIINWLANSIVAIMDNERAGLSFSAWQIVTWEGSSTLMTLALLPLLIVASDRFPLRIATLRRNLLVHLALTVPWSAAHVAGMVALRKLVYLTAGSTYDFGPVLTEFGYEYLKDFRSYFTLLAAIYLYRFALLRLQGEAQFVGESQDEEEDQRPVVDRFLVKKLGREFLVRVDDIDWIEAAGNYVNLHVGNRLYPLRDTMTRIEARLSEAGFVRVHRSAIVNLDRIAEIEPFDTGDARARLLSGADVPVSRRYRASLRTALG